VAAHNRQAAQNRQIVDFHIIPTSDRI